MTPELNGCGMIMHASCALTNWPEARAVPTDNAKAVACWIFEDIQCRLEKCSRLLIYIWKNSKEQFEAMSSSVEI